MATFALLVELKAKSGKESEVEAFLKKEASLVKKEPGTLTWHAAKVEGETGVYRVFDTFNDEAGRESHLNGEAGQELWSKRRSYFPRLLRCIGFRWSQRSKAQQQAAL